MNFLTVFVSFFANCCNKGLKPLVFSALLFYVIGGRDLEFFLIRETEMSFCMMFFLVLRRGGGGFSEAFRKIQYGFKSIRIEILQFRNDVANRFAVVFFEGVISACNEIFCRHAESLRDFDRIFCRRVGVFVAKIIVDCPLAYPRFFGKLFYEHILI